MRMLISKDVRLYIICTIIIENFMSSHILSVFLNVNYLNRIKSECIVIIKHLKFRNQIK